MPKTFKETQKIINKIDGWLNPPVVRLLYRLVRSLPENANIVEIGSWKGKSTCLLALASPDSCKVYAIDPHIGSHEHKELFGEVDTFQDFLDNLAEAKVSDRVESIRKYSREAVDLVPREIDFLWIDGSHDYEDVRKDFDLYFPKLKPGSWVAMHDYKWQGVKQFTWELLSSKESIGLVYRVEDTHYFQKNLNPTLFTKLLNQLRLLNYRLFQAYKRIKRKVKKKLKFKAKN